jgi:predicted dehydrogenase
VGTDSSAVCDYNVAQYKIKMFENRHVANGDAIKANEGAVHQLEFPPEEPLRAELAAFIDAIEKRRPSPVDGWAGIHAVRVVEAHWSPREREIGSIFLSESRRANR